MRSVMLPDRIFSDPRLAPLYDAFDGSRDDLEHYLAIVEELDAHSVMDVGCGTGSFAVLLAAKRIPAIGVDPAAASLAVARRKPGADGVTWVRADAATLPRMNVDLAVMTGNVAQVFVTDASWRDALAGIHRVVRTGGHLVFETRRPQYRAWEHWSPGERVVTREIAGVGAVVERFTVTNVAPPLVSFRHSYTWPDGTTAHSESTICVRGREEVEASLAATGFTTLDVREAPDRPGAEYVFVTRRE